MKRPVVVLMCLAVLATRLSARENLLPNSSFELGPCPDSWAISSGPLNLDCMDFSTAFHGSASIKLPMVQSTLFSGPVMISEPGDYVFSVHVKCSTAAVLGFAVETEDGKGVAHRKSTVGVKWQREELPVKLPAGTYNVRLASQETKGGEWMWADAASLCMAGHSGSAEFAPRSNMEAGLFSDVPAKAFYAGEMASIDLRVANYSEQPAQTGFRYVMTDIYGNSSPEKTIDPGAIAPGTTKLEKAAIDTSRRGLFSMRGRLSGASSAVVEICYCVIPRPADNTILAAHTSISRAAMTALRRIGIRWYESLTDSILRPENVRPSRESFVWHDDRVNMIPEYGMQAIGCMESGAIGEWGCVEPRKLDPPIVVRGSVMTQFADVKPDVWREHVHAIMSHYRRQIHNWVVDDEILSVPAFTYLERLRIMHDEARKIDPGIRVSTSADVNWFEELVDIGGRDVFDAVSGSIGNADYWEARKTGWLAAMYKKDTWVTGIFGNSKSFYHTNVSQGSWLSDATGMYRHTTRCFFLQHATSVAPYIFRYGIFSATRTMPFTMFDFDGSLKPHGIGFIMAGNVVAGMKPDPDPLTVVRLREGEYHVHRFVKNGKTGLYMCGKGQKIRVKLPGAKVEILDWFENPVDMPAVNGADSEIALILDTRPFYLYAKGVADQSLSRAVQDAELAPEIRKTSMFMVRDGRLGQASLVMNLDGTAKIEGFQDVKLRFTNRPIENNAGCWLANCLANTEPVKIDGKLDEWQNRSACWMYVDWNANSPPTRRTMHIASGGHFINYKPWEDFKVGFHAGHDDRNLYLAFLVNDDDVAPSEMRDTGQYDGVKVMIDKDILGDLATAFGSDDDFAMEARLLNKNKVEACLIHKGARTPLETAVGQRDGGYTMEIAIPLEKIGFSPVSALSAAGFDVIASDADYNSRFTGEEKYKREYSELRWAANSEIGTLLMLPRDRKEKN